MSTPFTPLAILIIDAPGEKNDVAIITHYRLTCIRRGLYAGIDRIPQSDRQVRCIDFSSEAPEGEQRAARGNESEKTTETILIGKGKKTRQKSHSRR